jgi:hypothetical protein
MVRSLRRPEGVSSPKGGARGGAQAKGARQSLAPRRCERTPRGVRSKGRGGCRRSTMLGLRARGSDRCCNSAEPCLMHTRQARRVAGMPHETRAWRSLPDTSAGGRGDPLARLTDGGSVGSACLSPVLARGQVTSVPTSVGRGCVGRGETPHGERGGATSERR